MLESGDPEIGVEQLLTRMREGAARQQSGADVSEEYESALRSNASNTTNPARLLETAFFSETDSAPLALQPKFVPHPDNSYHAHDLLKYHDRNFVENAYRAILKRTPDASGFNELLEGLRAGRLNKWDVLASLRYSPEGEAKNVRVEGLRLPATIRRVYRLPVIGYVAQLLIGVMRLPAMIHSQQQFEAYTIAQHQQIGDFINDARAQLTAATRALAKSRDEQQLAQEQLRERLAALSQHFEASFTQAIAQSQNQATRLRTGFRDEIQQIWHKQQETRTELVLQARRISLLLEEARGQLSASPDNQQLQAIAAEETHALDALYVSLEDQLRGSRAEIIERLKVYLPLLTAARLGSEEMPVLDLGCGRGEWLELLKAEGLRAVGVDTNSIAIAQCRERGLNVAEADVMNYLRALPEKSVGAVTGFHIIEHLPLDVLMKLLDEIVRVIKPGGAVIFETPNPQNVLVGSCNFYFDPTHRNPLPSQLMKFLISSRGFARVEIMNLNPSDAVPVEGADELVKRFNEYFYGPMDYAVIGWSAAA